MKPPKYTYVVGQKYWYFRRAGLLEALEGVPGDDSFELMYLAALSKAEARVAARARDMSRRAEAARERRLATRDNEPQGLIYFIGGRAGPVKIGFTTNLTKRLSRLQMNSPQKLRVIASRKGTRTDELRLHRKHETARLHGEWFRRTDDIDADIKAILQRSWPLSKEAGTEEAQSKKLLTAEDCSANSFRKRSA